jgi:hypothetical protein
MLPVVSLAITYSQARLTGAFYLKFLLLFLFVSFCFLLFLIGSLCFLLSFSRDILAGTLNWRVLSKFLVVCLIVSSCFLLFLIVSLCLLLFLLPRHIIRPLDTRAGIAHWRALSA